MYTPLRILRAQAENLRRIPIPPTPRDIAQRADILERGAVLLALNGRTHLTKTRVAKALRMSPLTFERHFADLDDLLGEILYDHLHSLALALREICASAPDRVRLLCLAYLAHTRTEFGQMTAAHFLLVRERRFLPDDMFEPIEEIRQYLGECIYRHAGLQVLDFLDAPGMSAAGIGRMLAFVDATMAPPQRAAVPLEITAEIETARGGPPMPAAMTSDLDVDDLARLRPARANQNNALHTLWSQPPPAGIAHMADAMLADGPPAEEDYAFTAIEAKSSA